MVVSTHLKNISQIGSSPQLGLKINQLTLIISQNYNTSESLKLPVETNSNQFPLQKKLYMFSSGHHIGMIQRKPRSDPISLVPKLFMLGRSSHLHKSHG